MNNIVDQNIGLLSVAWMFLSKLKSVAPLEKQLFYFMPCKNVDIDFIRE